MEVELNTGDWCQSGFAPCDPFVRIRTEANGGHFVDLGGNSMIELAINGHEPGELTDFFVLADIEPPADDDPFWLDLARICEEGLT